jgi:hypothetical protein
MRKSIIVTNNVNSPAVPANATSANHQTIKHSRENRGQINSVKLDDERRVKAREVTSNIINNEECHM